MGSFFLSIGWRILRFRRIPNLSTCFLFRDVRSLTKISLGEKVSLPLLKPGIRPGGGHLPIVNGTVLLGATWSCYGYRLDPSFIKTLSEMTWSYLKVLLWSCSIGSLLELSIILHHHN